MIAPIITPQAAPVLRDPLRWLAYAWLATGVTDGICASLLSTFGYHSTPTRLFQGVAATMLGSRALEGGTRTAAVGLMMHFGVAFAWSAVFVMLVVASSRLHTRLVSPYGPLQIAAVFGPCVWMVMSLVVIPLAVKRPPVITGRWWIQLVAHIPFVAIPMVTTIARGVRRSAAPDSRLH